MYTQDSNNESNNVFMRLFSKRSLFRSGSNIIKSDFSPSNHPEPAATSLPTAGVSKSVSGLFTETHTHYNSGLKYTVADNTFHVLNAYGMGALRDIINGIDIHSNVLDCSHSELVYKARNANIIIENDLDMSIYTEWTPIQNWTGALDGCDYTISNLCIDSSHKFAGLFDCILAPYLSPSRYYIKDLHMRNCIIKTTGCVAGGIVGYAHNMLVQDCSFEVDVLSGVFNLTSSGDTGGICGVISNSVLLHCSAKCNVYGNWAAPVVGLKVGGQIVGCYGVSTRVFANFYGGSCHGGIGDLCGCVSLYVTLRGRANSMSTRSNPIDCYAATDYSDLLPYMQSVNQTCHNWLATHPDYIATQKFNEGGDTLSFIPLHD